jgi:hypothetical protein
MMPLRAARRRSGHAAHVGARPLGAARPGAGGSSGEEA